MYCSIHPCAHAHMVTGLAVRRRIRNSVWVILFAFSSNNSLIEANTLTAGLFVFPLFFSRSLALFHCKEPGRPNRVRGSSLASLWQKVGRSRELEFGGFSAFSRPLRFSLTVLFYRLLLLSIRQLHYWPTLFWMEKLNMNSNKYLEAMGHFGDSGSMAGIEVDGTLLIAGVKSNG